MSLILYTRDFSLRSRLNTMRSNYLNKRLTSINKKIEKNKKILSHTDKYHAEKGKELGSLIGQGVAAIAGTVGVGLSLANNPLVLASTPTRDIILNPSYGGFMAGALAAGPGGWLGGKIGYRLGLGKNKRTHRKQKHLYKRLDKLNNKLYRLNMKSSNQVKHYSTSEGKPSKDERKLARLIKFRDSKFANNYRSTTHGKLASKNAISIAVNEAVQRSLIEPQLDPREKSIIRKIRYTLIPAGVITDHGLKYYIDNHLDKKIDKLKSKLNK